jgi:hypothetical protein
MTSERDWRELLNEFEQAARAAEFWEKYPFMQTCVELSRENVEAHVSAKREELVEAVENYVDEQCCKIADQTWEQAEAKYAYD